jgi:manganese/zinc/iron transport system permease protein
VNSGVNILALTWTSIDTSIVLTGALAAAACSLLGVFLLLRRMSMMGDAISHAVLPGLAAAFLITGSRDSIVMLCGAAVVGVLTALFTEWVRSAGKVDEGASMGVVFTILFAIGLIMMEQAAGSIDIDAECVLYGALETVALDTPVMVMGLAVPHTAVRLAVVLLADALFLLLFFKELKISTFDPALATSLGINARVLHYLLMTMVAITTVAAFESVGSILVIAMLIVPAAAAHLLSDRLGGVLVLSVLLALASAGLGHVGALLVPGWFGYEGVSTSTSGMMAVAAGLIFGAAMLLAPRHGVIAKLVNQARLSLRIVREDVLGRLVREEEAGRAAALSGREVRTATATAGPILGRLALLWLTGGRLLARAGGAYRLTDAGRVAARQVLRSHRLWETYLDRHLALPPDHLHAPAERLEHVTTPAMRQRLAESVDNVDRDPQGKEIPRG